MASRNVDVGRWNTGYAVLAGEANGIEMSDDGKESGEGDESHVGSPACCAAVWCSLACLGAEVGPTLRSNGRGEMSPVSRLATQARRWPGDGPGPRSRTWMPVERRFCRSAGLRVCCWLSAVQAGHAGHWRVPSVRRAVVGVPVYLGLSLHASMTYLAGLAGLVTGSRLKVHQRHGLYL